MLWRLRSQRVIIIILGIGRLHGIGLTLFYSAGWYYEYREMQTNCRKFPIYTGMNQSDFEVTKSKVKVTARPDAVKKLKKHTLPEKTY